MTPIYDVDYFDAKMDEATKEAAFEKGKTAEKVLSKAPTNRLKALFVLDGKEFYRKLLETLGTLRFLYPRDKALQKGIDELKQATGLEGDDFEKYLKDNNIDPNSYKVNGESTIKLAIGKILGFLRVVWDTAILSFGLFGRVSVKLVGNVGKALMDTAVYAKDEAKAVGGEVKESWNRNIKN